MRRGESAVDDRLGAIVHAIADAVHPRRILLYGSRARGDARPDSDYDLVIEAAFDPGERERLMARLRNVVWDAAGGTPVDVMLRGPGEIEHRRDDPGYIDWDIAREGVIVYPDADLAARAHVSRISADRVRERSRGASVDEWLARAEEDRRTIEVLIAAGPKASWLSVCFHAQQMAEKHLKVLFVRSGVRPPRTHDLRALVAGLRDLGYAFPDLASECDALQEYAVAVRYPEEVTIPSESQAMLAWHATQRIVELATSARESR